LTDKLILGAEGIPKEEANQVLEALHHASLDKALAALLAMRPEATSDSYPYTNKELEQVISKVQSIQADTNKCVDAYIASLPMPAWANSDARRPDCTSQGALNMYCYKRWKNYMTPVASPTAHFAKLS
jgi:hypothetical protein